MNVLLFVTCVMHRDTLARHGADRYHGGDADLAQRCAAGAVVLPVLRRTRTHRLGHRRTLRADASAGQHRGSATARGRHHPPGSRRSKQDARGRGGPSGDQCPAHPRRPHGRSAHRPSTLVRRGRRRAGVGGRVVGAPPPRRARADTPRHRRSGGGHAGRLLRHIRLLGSLRAVPRRGEPDDRQQ